MKKFTKQFLSFTAELPKTKFVSTRRRNAYGAEKAVDLKRELYLTLTDAFRKSEVHVMLCNKFAEEKNLSKALETAFAAGLIVAYGEQNRKVKS